MIKFEIKNRKSQRVVCVLEENFEKRGLVFVCHGLGGFKEQKHVRTFCKAFYDKGFTVVSFDTTNTFGESDGNYEDATTTNYYEDLEDVIEYSKNQTWYLEPFYLCGHSLGGVTILTYALRHEGEVKGLVPVSSVVSGNLSVEGNKDEVEKWEKTGWRISESSSVPKRIKKLKWSHMIDRMKYDILPDARKIKVPVLLIVGSKDDTTPAAHQKMLFDKLGGQRQLNIIEDGPHTFTEKKQLDEISRILTIWIDEVEHK